MFRLRCILQNLTFSVTTSGYISANAIEVASVAHIDWPQSLMSICFSKTDNLSKIAIYKLNLEVEILGWDVSKFDYQRG